MINVKFAIFVLHLCLLNTIFLFRHIQYYEDQQLQQHDTERKFTRHHHQDMEITQKERTRKIVVIGGPHKTGSTSMHENLVHWIQTHEGFSNWRWPVPKDHPNDDLAWGFGHLAWTLVPKKCNETYYYYIFPGDWDQLSCEMIRDIYRDEIDTQWSAGYDLVIGTEEFDFISQNRESLAIDIGQLLNTIVPWKHDPNAEKGEVHWVVKYRSPRASHLISGWHQCCADTMTFLEFLNKYPKLTFAAYFVDSLYYVERLLQHPDIHVVLMGISDLNGTEHEKVDASTIVACNVLGIPCDKYDNFVSGNKEKPIVSNVKTGIGNMGKYFTEDMIPQIEHVFRRRDCAYAHLLSKDNLQLLYAHDLVKILSDCLARGDTGITRDKMISSLLHIAHGKGLPEDI